MDFHDRLNLTRIVNAAGTYSPLGISRSSENVSEAVAAALREFFVIDELQAAASDAIARATGAEAAAVTHCVAAGITLSIAAAMAGSDPEKLAALPDTSGMPNRVVLPAGHAVNYGHPIVQDVRLAGPTPVLAGTDAGCSDAELERALAHPDTACLLLVSSRLVRGEPLDLAGAVAAAHRRGVPAIIDGAAQDMRIPELLATGADLVLVSAHKYMAAPTAGLVIGGKDLVAAVRAHEKGIGRAMKATKEAIVGVLAAQEDRQRLNLDAWRQAQTEKVRRFVEQANSIPGLTGEVVPDPAGMPFPRARLTIDPTLAGMDAPALAGALRAGDPAIWVMEHEAAQGRLLLELVPLDAEEVETILDRLGNPTRPAGIPNAG